MSAPLHLGVQPHSCSTCAIERAFCSARDDVRSAFERLKTSSVHQRGETVFRESEPCHSVFVVCEGTVKLITTSSEGKVLLLRYAGPGEVLGAAEAVRDRAPYECSGIAIETSVVAAIAADTFMRFVASSSDSCVRLVTALSEEYKRAQRETRFLAFGETSTARLARLLLDLSRNGEHSSEGIRIPNRVTHTDLAQSIGSTRETVTRILSALAERGIVERRRGDIVIRSEHELARLGTY